MLKLVVFALVLSLCAADLRMASQPKNNFRVISRNNRKPFKAAPQGNKAFYMEPSTFNYAGLKAQRDGGGYDNFLRSNIDNEQDKRSFNNEGGMDHLPFRSFNGAVTDSHSSIKNKLPAGQGLIRVTPGEQFPVPLRWNNPHQSELEVNIWIMNAGAQSSNNNGPGTMTLLGAGACRTATNAQGLQTRLQETEDACKNLCLQEPTCVGVETRPGQTYCEIHTELVTQVQVITTTSNCWTKTGASLNAVEPIVVPIRKPACAGEGHGDAVFNFKVPTDFNNLGSKIPGFKGCKQVGDCVLQIYAHSVETRMYAMGTPLIVDGAVGPVTATRLQIEQAREDVGLNLNALTHHLCLSSADPAVHITTSVPRRARLISDVANHAYQNSDYSPYSGQQPEAISRNVQAAAIIKMVTGNRGELGKKLLRAENNQARQLAAKLRQKSNNLIQNYETTVNNMIGVIGRNMKNADTTMPQGQETKTCFRCEQVGSVTARRQTTNTYVPSFKIDDPQLLARAKNMVSNSKKNLIDDQGRVLIYEAVLKDLAPAFEKASQLGLNYMGPVMKGTMATMVDTTNFRKRDANGNTDGGLYAAKMAKQNGIHAETPFTIAALTAGSPSTVAIRPSFELAVLIDDDEEDNFMAELGSDMDGLKMDSNCDDDRMYDPLLDNDDNPCVVPEVALFKQDGSMNDNLGASMSSAAATPASWLLTACAMFLAILLQRN